MINDIINNRFLAEIYEQPQALKETLDLYLEGEGQVWLSEAVQHWNRNETRQIIFTGMGSSYFISNLAATILNSYGIPALAINAGELIHYQFPVIAPGNLLICISQSGESFEIIRILEKRSDNVICIGICNEPESSLSKCSDVMLLSKAGKEFMTSTKTFSATAMVAIIFSICLAGHWKSETSARTYLVIDSVKNLINSHLQWLPQAMEFVRKVTYIQLIARGPSMAAAQQGALMFMEGARNPASALFSGEFRHGPMELVQKGFLAIILAPEGETYYSHLKLAGDIIHFDGRVIFLTNKEPEVIPTGMLCLNIPCHEEYYFSIPAIIPLQFMVNQCAMEKGFIPGEFIRGSKITKIE